MAEMNVESTEGTLDILDSMLERIEEAPISNEPPQRYILSGIQKLHSHLVDNGRLYFLLSFTSPEFGRRRWMSAHALRYRTELMTEYWNRKAIEQAREIEEHRHHLSLETTVLGVYDF